MAPVDPRPPDGEREIPCPSCGRVNPTGFRFCGACGTALERTCRACGATVAADFRFCGACGTPLETSVAPVEPPVEERKIVTALFADLTASTELAARLDPEDLRDVLGHFFEAMADEIRRFGGTIEKFIGDAIVAVFGVPAAHEDDPERAVRAALAMQRRLRELNAEFAGRDIDLSMRVGLNTGEVVAEGSAVGERLVTGEVVHAASRLQALAAPGGIVVGERTFRDARERFTYSPLGETLVKGFDRPIPAWEVVGEAEPRPALPTVPFVGRESELELLSVLLTRTIRERTPSLATLVGPAGIGKSRLSHEFMQATAGSKRPPRVVKGRCLPYGDGLTYWPLAEILKADAGILDSDAEGTIVAKARTTLDPRLLTRGDAAATAHVLLSSIGVQVAPDPLDDMRPDVARELIMRAWRVYFESLAAEEPVVVVVEDIHWADENLLDLIEALAARSAGPIMIVCLSRPDLTDRRPNWGGGLRNAMTVVLPPLSDTESERLVRHVLGGHAPYDVVARVLDRAEGNPFFAQELLRMLTDDHTLVRKGDMWTLDRPLPDSLPDTVQGVIASRIDLLEPAEKRAVQDAAVVGRIFWQGAVEALGSNNAAAALDTLVDTAIVHEREYSAIAGERELIFNHILTRDVAYATIPRSRRPQAHAAAGKWIENMTGGRAEEFAEILVHHFGLAGDTERTARYAMLAGHRKRRVFAAEEAIAWYEKALSLAATSESARALVAETELGRGAVLEQLGSYAEAQAAYEEAVDAARETGDGSLETRALAALAHIHRMRDHHTESSRILAKALARARSLGAQDVVARLLYTAGTIAFGEGEWTEAISLHEQALLAAKESGDLEGEALARHGILETRWSFGGFAEALDHGARASEIFRALGRRPMLYENEYMRGFVLWLAGRHEEAEAALAAAVTGTNELGDRRNEAAARAPQTMLFLSQGRLGSALETAKTAVELISALDTPRMALTCRSYRMDLLTELGALEHLERELVEARQLADRIGGNYLRPSLFAFEGLVRLRAGDEEAARSLFEQGYRAAHDSLFEALRCARLELLAGGEQGDPGTVARAADRLVSAARAETPVYLAWGEYGLALAAALQGRADESRDLAERAAATAEGAGDACVLWRAKALAGQTDEAMHIVAAIVDSIADDELRAWFLGRPDVAEIVASRR